jgi:hypothetical protein
MRHSFCLIRLSDEAFTMKEKWKRSRCNIQRHIQTRHWNSIDTRICHNVTFSIFLSLYKLHQWVWSDGARNFDRRFITMRLNNSTRLHQVDKLIVKDSIEKMSTLLSFYAWSLLTYWVCLNIWFLAWNSSEFEVFTFYLRLTIVIICKQK